MEQYYGLCQQVSHKVLEAFEIAMKLPLGSFTSKCTKGASEVRLLHYPEIDIKEMKSGKVNRVWPHTDLGVITLLFQDSSGGLEIEDREHPGNFIPIENGSSPLSEVCVNVSETFQRWTNDKVKAGVHQVTIPSHLKDLKEGVIPTRYSHTYFVKADRDALAGTLEEFVSETEPALYENITALDYHQKRLATAY